MKISLQNTNIINARPNPNFGNIDIKRNISSIAKKLLKTPDRDCFVRSKTPFDANAFFAKRDKLHISEYLELQETDKKEIRQSLSKEIKKAADSSIIMAKGLTKFLDKKYGKDGYVFVSIGTSPSLIAKAMECMGIETRYLPISGLASKYFDTESAICDPDFFKRYGEFLKEQGITKENLEKSDKKYVFYDYTVTGTTLKRFEAIMEYRFDLPYEKTVFRSIDDDLVDIFEDTGRESAADYHIDYYMGLENAQHYSSIEHLDIASIKHTKYIPERLTKHSNPKAKLFNFTLMDKLYKSGNLKENPKNAVTL